MENSCNYFLIWHKIHGTKKFQSTWPCGHFMSPPLLWPHGMWMLPLQISPANNFCMQKSLRTPVQRVGLKPIKPRLDIKQLPLNKDTIPDIMKKLNKLNPMFFQNSFLCDDSISKMTFQVTNIAYYHKNEDKLVDDILRFLIRVVNYP